MERETVLRIDSTDLQRGGKNGRHRNDGSQDGWKTGSREKERVIKEEREKM